MTSHDPNDPNLRSYISVDPTSHFPIQNLPFGIFSTSDERSRRAGIAIGNQILDLSSLEAEGLIRVGKPKVFGRETLNEFLAEGRIAWTDIRNAVSQLLRHDVAVLRDNSSLRKRAFVEMRSATMHMPVHVGGFSDFMLSKEHSTNCVDIVGGAKAGELWPNWHHLPMGYNSRASSVVVSGTPIRRPWGQIKPPDATTPVHAVGRQLDFELEISAVIGTANELGAPISLEDAEDHVFGLVLLNDWSARDIQAWEAQPLGVFNSKNLSTSISPWIVTMAALEPFRSGGPKQDPLPLPYLRQSGLRNVKAHLEASILPRGETKASVVCRSRLDTLYWSFAQQVVHQTSAGCNVQPGDLLATGTVSSNEPGALGCLFEVTRAGRQSFLLEHGGRRTYLEDGDEVVLTGWCQGDGYRVGFGECVGQIFEANPRVA